MKHNDFEYNHRTGGWSANTSNSSGSGLEERPVDPVNAPPYYIFGPYEVRAVLQAWADEVDITKSESNDWFSMQQYLFRYCRKGKPLRDLKKARKYLDWIIERYDENIR